MPVNPEIINMSASVDSLRLLAATECCNVIAESLPQSSFPHELDIIFMKSMVGIPLTSNESNYLPLPSHLTESEDPIRFYASHLFRLFFHGFMAAYDPIVLPTETDSMQEPLNLNFLSMRYTLAYLMTKGHEHRARATSARQALAPNDDSSDLNYSPSSDLDLVLVCWPFIENPKRFQGKTVVQWVFNSFSLNPPLPPFTALSDEISENIEETSITTTCWQDPIPEWLSRIGRRISTFILDLFRPNRPSPIAIVARHTRIEMRLSHPILEQVIRLARRTSAMHGVDAAEQMTKDLDSDFELPHEKNPLITPTPECLGLYENEGHICNYCHYDHYLHMSTIKDLEYIIQWPCCYAFQTHPAIVRSLLQCPHCGSEFSHDGDLIHVSTLADSYSRIQRHWSEKYVYTFKMNPHFFGLQ